MTTNFAGTRPRFCDYCKQSFVIVEQSEAVEQLCVSCLYEAEMRGDLKECEVCDQQGVNLVEADCGCVVCDGCTDWRTGDCVSCAGAYEEHVDDD